MSSASTIPSHKLMLQTTQPNSSNYSATNRFHL